jgi:hypothetical protein
VCGSDSIGLTVPARVRRPRAGGRGGAPPAEPPQTPSTLRYATVVRYRVWDDDIDQLHALMLVYFISRSSTVQVACLLAFLHISYNVEMLP